MRVARGRRLAIWFANLVVAAVCVAVLLNAPGVIRLEAGSATTSLPVDLACAWFYSVPLTYMALSVLVTATLFLIAGETPAAQEAVTG